MTDRELLEMAAKAAGVVLTWGSKYMVGDDEVDCTDIPYATSDSPDCAPYYWNPLEDDGDALRLAVKLEIDVNHGDTLVVAEKVRPIEYGVAEQKGTDPYAATRRAIVRAAAEIGKEIK